MTRINTSGIANIETSFQMYTAQLWSAQSANVLKLHMIKKEKLKITIVGDIKKKEELGGLSGRSVDFIGWFNGNQPSTD